MPLLKSLAVRKCWLFAVASTCTSPPSIVAPSIATSLSFRFNCRLPNSGICEIWARGSVALIKMKPSGAELDDFAVIVAPPSITMCLPMIEMLPGSGPAVLRV